MRILFLRHPMRNVGGTGIYTKLLIQELVSRKHVIGLWPTDGMVYKDLFELPIKRLNSNVREMEEDWDVIVIQHTQTLFYANHIIQQLPDTPHVFISHSSLSNDQILPYRQLFKVIRIADSIYNNWGVPDEMQETIYNPQFIPEFQAYALPRTKPFNIVLISRLNPDRVELVRDVIFTINQMPDYDLHVVGGGMDYMLRSSANENISFEGEQLDVQTFYRQADLVIGSGRTAVEAMAYSKPVIIAGLRGLGGLITPDRYERFKKIMFSGRFDGTLNERIPREGLIASIMATQKKVNLPEIVRENYFKVKQDFDIRHIAQRIESTLINVVELNNYIHNPDLIINLKPKMVSNCELIRDSANGSYNIIRLTSGQYLGHLDQTGRRIIARFNGKNTLKECLQMQSLNNPECLDEYIIAVQKLWHNKIITF
jgi:glycosyltransferase involved in cell wall biosynthesis